MENEKGNKKKVLVVEDDAFLRKILTTKFGKEGFDVIAAEDGEEALEKVKAEKPDFVLLDLIIPKMNGFEVLAEMKTDESLSRIPVIVLSNLGQQEDIERVKELGAVAYLEKTEMSINDVVKNAKQEYAKHMR